MTNREIINAVCAGMGALPETAKKKTREHQTLALRSTCYYALWIAGNTHDECASEFGFKAGSVQKAIAAVQADTIGGDA